MYRIDDLTAFLDGFAPAHLAETWDNVGLLLGDRRSPVDRVLTCLTLTPDVAEEAIRERAAFVVTHHPILFRAVKRITADDAQGAMLLALARANVAVYSPHTAFDSTSEGINDRLCAKLEIHGVRPLRPRPANDTDAAFEGSGRFGERPVATDFATFAADVRRAIQLPSIDAVSTTRSIKTVAVACGSAAEFLPDAVQAGCDVLVTGEARFHAALDARTQGIGLVLLGHYASERFAVEELADVIAAAFPSLTVWPSRDERDPLDRF
ncbi:MAG: Nif3-like dinuclear metal center hexameric protein [Planctomycetota bacterium]|nr:Nif3-like dinuclear metal center hexameric protein [Planctomycetaceae bacterium]MDQ3329855.1 Nif3-like dinuclear metal center hexameric protein [Planctomycetota bacterium]